VEAQQTRAESGEPSVLGVYRQLLALRRSHEVFRGGTCDVLDLGDDSPVIAFRRRMPDGTDGGATIVIINFSSTTARLPSLPDTAESERHRTPLFATHPESDSATLQPWEVRVLQDRDPA
jgi:glycosidase